MTKTYGTITGLAPARGGKLYLTSASGDVQRGLELPINISGNGQHIGRFSSWEVYVNGVKVEGLVPTVSGGKLVLDLPSGACLIIR